MQKALTLIIAIAILYTIIKNNFGHIPDTSTTTSADKTEIKETKSTDAEPVETEGSFLEKTMSKVLINALKTEEGKIFFENLLRPENKALNGGVIRVNNDEFLKSIFKIKTFGEGFLSSALCGHIVKVNYQILTMNNHIVNEEVKTFALGTRPIVPGLDIVITGMKIGETRHAILPPKYAYGEPKYKKQGIDQYANYKLNVTLEEILPHNFVGEETKTFDDLISYKIPMMCGDSVVFDVKITRLSNGKVIFDTKAKNDKIIMKIGDINQPLIFSYALHGKPPIGTRTIITKGKSLQSLSIGASKIFSNKQFPKDEYFLIEFSSPSE